MRHSLIVFVVFLAASLGSTPRAEAVSPHIEAGIGLPELVHMRVGAVVHPRVSVEAYGGNAVLNWLVGIGTTAYWFDPLISEERYSHSLFTRATFAFNPVTRPIQFRSGGDRLGGVAMLATGYAFSTDIGLYALVGVQGYFYVEQTFLVGGPGATLSVGFHF